MSAFSHLRCPFCGAEDYDRIGLRHHLKGGWCAEFEKHETDERSPDSDDELPEGCWSQEDRDLDGVGV